jgi:hypothetical protein
MIDFKLKLVLSVLTGLVFSFIFIILAFALPSKEKMTYNKKAEGKLEKVAESFKNR